MIFTFKSKFVGFGSPETTMEFEADQIEDVITYFEQFLKGAGYVFDGQLQLVDGGTRYTYENFEPPTMEELRGTWPNDDGFA